MRQWPVGTSPGVGASSPVSGRRIGGIALDGCGQALRCALDFLSLQRNERFHRASDARGARPASALVGSAGGIPMKADSLLRKRRT